MNHTAPWLAASIKKRLVYRLTKKNANGTRLHKSHCHSTICVIPARPAVVTASGKSPQWFICTVSNSFKIISFSCFMGPLTS